MKGKNWTPVDAFVTEYGFRTGKTFIYQPGSGEATMETGLGMDLDQLRKLIKSIEHHELQINIDGTIFIYDPEKHGEKPMKPDRGYTPSEEAETEPEIEKHRAPTPEEIEAMKLEDEEIPEEIVEVIEDMNEEDIVAEIHARARSRVDEIREIDPDELPETIEEKKESSEEDVVIIE